MLEWVQTGYVCTILYIWLKIPCNFTENRGVDKLIVCESAETLLLHREIFCLGCSQYASNVKKQAVIIIYLHVNQSKFLYDNIYHCYVLQISKLLTCPNGRNDLRPAISQILVVK